MNGQFRAVFQKLNALHSKNAFSLALVVGNLFSDPSSSTTSDDHDLQDLIDGKIELALPIYFALRDHALPSSITEKLDANDGEVCPNLYFLGKRTTTKTSEGIRIVALGGMLDSNIATDGSSKDQSKYLPFYTEQDAKILKGANKADILITSQWPSSVHIGSKVPLPEGISEPTSQNCVAELCDTLKPRYHFSSSADLFYEREPFFHAPKEEEQGTYLTTRFLSLASYGNDKKQKWIYAFSLDPSAAPLPSIPTGTTASPFSFLNVKKRAPLPDQQTRYSTHGDHYERPRKRHKKDRAPPPTQSECYFCLSRSSQIQEI